MQRDREMLELADAGAPPMLRLYRWSRPTLSLGRRQELAEAADPEALARLGIVWIRRPTGGRALLHRPDDLTYAFAAPRGTAAGVLGAYRLVMSAIREGLEPFVVLDPERNAGGRDRAAARLPCLAVATGHELAVGGRKLVAGAQRWRRGAFLQHGSIPWTVDSAMTNRAVGLPADAPLTAVGLAEAAARFPISPESVAASMVAAFGRRFAQMGVLA